MPLYENDETRADQKRIARHMMSLYPQYIWARVWTAARLDYSIVLSADPDEIRATCEVRCRRYTMDRLHGMGGFQMDKSKWEAARDAFRVDRVPFWLIVECDGVLWEHHTDDFKYDREGPCQPRTDRNDPNDLDLVIYLLKDRFRPIPRI